MAKRKRKREAAETWAQRIDAWQRSGLSVNDFATREGLCKTTFLRWRKKLGGERWVCLSGGEPREKRKKAQPIIDVGGGQHGEGANAVSFVELTAGQLPPAASAQVEYGVPFEVSLRSGRRLQVPATFDPEVLRHLIVILEVQ